MSFFVSVFAQISHPSIKDSSLGLILRCHAVKLSSTVIYLRAARKHFLPQFITKVQTASPNFKTVGPKRTKLNISEYFGIQIADSMCAYINTKKPQATLAKTSLNAQDNVVVFASIAGHC